MFPYKFIFGKLFVMIQATHAAWANRFASLFTRSIYKWVQAPLSLHLGNVDIERERALQHPVITRPEWRQNAR